MITKSYVELFVQMKAFEQVWAITLRED